MNLPAHLAARQSRNLATAAMAGLSLGSPPHVSIKQNRFWLVDAAGNVKPAGFIDPKTNAFSLDVCVIDANPSVSKVYYREAYDPSDSEGKPPTCWSDNGIGASSQASEPQSQSCQLCQWNVWGSAQSNVTGKDTKACNDAKKLAVLIPGNDMVFLLRVPPATLKNLAKYTQTLSGHGVDLPDAVTRVSFDLQTQGVLNFTPVGYVDEATAALSEKIWSTNATEQLVGKTDRPFQGQLPAPGQGKEQYAARQNGQLPPPPNRPVEAQQAQQSPFNQIGQVAPTASGAFGTASPGADVAASPFAQAGTSSPPAATQEAKAPRKPRAPKAEPAPAADDGIPPFLQRTAAPPPAAPPAASFGMNPNPPAPDAGIQAALDAAFNLPT